MDNVPLLVKTLFILMVLSVAAILVPKNLGNYYFKRNPVMINVDGKGTWNNGAHYSCENGVTYILGHGRSSTYTLLVDANNKPVKCNFVK